MVGEKYSVDTFVVFRHKKKDPEGSLKICELESHEVVNANATIVAVLVRFDATTTECCSFCEWIGDHAVASLKSDFWLEGVLTNGTNHLERNIWAIEQTSVIR